MCDEWKTVLKPSTATRGLDLLQTIRLNATIMIRVIAKTIVVGLPDKNRLIIEDPMYSIPTMESLEL